MKNGEWNTGGIKLKDITNQCTFIWATAPTITAGTFPDSFIDGSHETKLEVYETWAAGAASKIFLLIRTPRICEFKAFIDVGVGAQRGAHSSATRKVSVDASIEADRNPWLTNNYKQTPTDDSFSDRLRKPYQSSIQAYGDLLKLSFYANTNGEWAFEIFQITVVEVVGV